MPALVPYVAAYSNELGPRESDMCLEVPRNGVPHIAYTHPRPDDRDAHGNLWARMTRPPESERGRVMWASMDPLRQRECMEGLLCQVCAKPAETDTGALFVEWERPGEEPTPLNRITTDAPPVCLTCLPLAFLACPFLRDDRTAVVLLARKSVLSGVSGTLYRVADDLRTWIPSDSDAYSSFTKPRCPGMLAQRLYRKLRGVTVVDPADLPPDLVQAS
ncbi:hypothetical protein [Streptomyces finlayi]|uniref:Uncharacterized protein n=1 Tax=Streptomyces finlayi TaxID=67296 RepID=A0A7G7BJX2_9ACTN|nr:hypothetical protein [Streptomyces finlayi]QNE75637.1 hypothetical protein F0344_14270 [Streptomyces finlayi]